MIFFSHMSEADTGFPERGGRGLSRVWIFILGPFVVGHITRCMDKMSTDKILGDKTPVKIARWDKMLGQGKQNSNLIKKTVYMILMVK